jgi:hypothetical protein
LQHFSSLYADRTSKVFAYKKYWLHLNKLTRDLGNASGFTYGSLTVIFFTISVLLSYGFVVELKNNFSFALSTTSLLFQVLILSQCNSAQRATSQVRSLWSSGQSSWLHNGDVLCLL